MLIYLLFSLAYLVGVTLTAFLPTAEVLPFGIDPILVNSFQGFYAFMNVFPPLAIVLQAFLLYCGFRLALLLFKVILGARAPNLN